MGNTFTKFENRSKLLEDFNKSIIFFRSRSDVSIPPLVKKKLLDVLIPLSQTLKNEQTLPIRLNEEDLLKKLKEKHVSEWDQYVEKISTLISNLLDSSYIFKLSSEVIDMLEEIAEILDGECIQLFQRLSER